VRSSVGCGATHPALLFHKHRGSTLVPRKTGSRASHLRICGSSRSSLAGRQRIVTQGPAVMPVRRARVAGQAEPLSRPSPLSVRCSLFTPKILTRAQFRITFRCFRHGPPRVLTRLPIRQYAAPRFPATFASGHVGRSGRSPRSRQHTCYVMLSRLSQFPAGPSSPESQNQKTLDVSGKRCPISRVLGTGTLCSLNTLEAPADLKRERRQPETNL